MRRRGVNAVKARPDLFIIRLLCVYVCATFADGGGCDAAPRVSSADQHCPARGSVSLSAFGVPDYDLQVETIATEPPYYCVTFRGRDGDKGLGAEGCAGLHELGLKGQHFFRTLVGTCEETALVVDVGANIGSHSSFPAALGARVISVEPHPYHARRLFHMAHLNDWNMRVFSGAADSRDGFAQINILGGGHLVMRDPAAVGEAGEHVERREDVAVTTKFSEVSVIVFLLLMLTLKVPRY
jgi:FkbM family methyltransferase